MRPVTRWVDKKEEIEFAAEQLKKYGTEPIWREQIINGFHTGKSALYRNDKPQKNND